MKKNVHLPDECISCTSCIAHCPVTAATHKFRGPKMVGPALERFRVSEKMEVEPSLEYCSNCKNCDISCPSGVPVSTLNMLARAEYYKTHKHSMRDWMLAHGETMGKLAAPFASLTNFALGNPINKALMGQIGMSTKRSMPKYASKTFYKQFKSMKQKPSDKKVIFYPGCFINYNDPQVGVDFVAVMQAAGYEVVVPESFVCCGAPMVSGGFLEEAEKNANINIAELNKWTEQGYPVVTCCTSCNLMLKQEYQELFEIPNLDKVAAKIYNATEFLLELIEEGKWAPKFQPYKERMVYHAPCHLRVQGIGRPSLDVLEYVPGLEMIDADAGCCGISGSYGFKEEKYEISMKVGSALFERIKDCKVQTVASDCGTCREQIAHGSGAKTIHPISIIRKSIGA